MTERESPLLTDLYQLNMVEAYLADGETKPAVFELVVRHLPDGADFCSPPGSRRRSIPGDVPLFAATNSLARHRAFQQAPPRLSRRPPLHRRRPRHPRGDVFFANEPILRITAPLPQAQLVETRLINILHFETLVASKAARLMLAAPGKAAGRFRLPPRPRRRGRAAGRARELHRRLRRHGDRSPAGIRRPDFRHHGALLRRGL